MKIVRRIGLSYIDYLVDSDDNDEAVSMVLDDPQLAVQIYFAPTYLSDLGFETHDSLSDYNNDSYYLDALGEIINNRPTISRKDIDSLIAEIENDSKA